MSSAPQEEPRVGVGRVRSGAQRDETGSVKVCRRLLAAPAREALITRGVQAPGCACQSLSPHFRSCHHFCLRDMLSCALQPLSTLFYSYSYSCFQHHSCSWDCWPFPANGLAGIASPDHPTHSPTHILSSLTRLARYRFNAPADFREWRPAPSFCRHARTHARTGCTESFGPGRLKHHRGKKRKRRIESWNGIPTRSLYS
jgi:hypothetical protein